MTDYTLEQIEDIRKRANANIGHGGNCGCHTCLDSDMARIELEECVPQLIKRVRELESTIYQHPTANWWRKAFLKWSAVALGGFDVSATSKLSDTQVQELQEVFGGTPSMIAQTVVRTAQDEQAAEIERLKKLLKEDTCDE